MLCQAQPKVDPLPFSKLFSRWKRQKYPKYLPEPTKGSQTWTDPIPPIPNGFAPWNPPNPTGCTSGMALKSLGILNSSRFSPPRSSSIPGSLLPLSPNSLCHLDLPLDCPLYSKPSGIQGKVLSDKNKELTPQDLLLEVEFLLGRKAGGGFQ